MAETKKIILSLEDKDPVTGYYLANGASPSWYTKEENYFRLPKMWGWWSIFDNRKKHLKFISSDLDSPIKEAVTPFLNEEEVEYRTKNTLNNSRHIYFIYISNPFFFKENSQIGFSCIDPLYKKDIREGQAKLVLYYPTEGHSGETGNHDLNILDKWVLAEGFPSDKVYYVHGNLIIDNLVKKNNHKFIGVPYIFFDSLPPLLNESPISRFKAVDDRYLFLCYCRTARPHKVRLTNTLLKKGLFDKGKISLGEFTDTNPELDALRKLVPITIDKDLDSLSLEDTPLFHYNSTFISILVETRVTENCIFFSEKIFKPIAMGHPFILLGNKGSLKYLHKLGYRTFGQWIDESYDDIDSYQLRIEKIVEEVKKLSSKSISELTLIREEMSEILLHNRNVLLKTRAQKGYRDSINRPIVEFLKSIY